MEDMKDKKDMLENMEPSEEYSLSDDRRVKVLSPGQLVMKRFFRNRLAVTGMVILLAMFIFSFIGGLLSPYGEDQKFYRVDVQAKDFAGILYNEEFRYTVGDNDLFKSSVHAQALKAIIQGNDKFEYNDNSYTLEKLSDDAYIVSSGGREVGIASKELVNPSKQDESVSFEFSLTALKAKNGGKKKFTAEGREYNIDDEGHPTQKLVLIENGILKNYLVDRLGSRRMGMPATGCGRRQNYHYEPTSRMSNTYIAAGKDDPEEIIGTMEYGLYAAAMGGGSVNPVTGEFNFAVREGYMVRDGKIAEPVRGATLIGKGSEILPKIDRVSRNLESAQGMCGSKSGSIPTNVGQPLIRVSSITVGGR